MTIRTMVRYAISVAVLAAPSAFASLEPLGEEDLQSIAGQDGVTVSISSPSVAADSYTWTLDRGTAYASTLKNETISLKPVGVAGGSLGVGSFNIGANIDVGADTAAGPSVNLALALTSSRARLRVDNARVGADPDSLGSWALDTGIKFGVYNRNGLFNTSGALGALYLELTDADLYYRQGAAGTAEVVMNNFDFLWNMPALKFGIDNSGLLLEGNATFNLTFDLRYEAAPLAANEYKIGTLAEDKQLLRYGWSGDMTSVKFQVLPGGSWDATTALSGAPPNQVYVRTAATQGLGSSIRWDYGPNFRWILGEVGGNRTALEFGSWQKLPSGGGGSTYGFELPFTTLDVINTAAQGPGGLCWGANWGGPSASCTNAVHGGQYIDVAPEGNNLAWLVRDGSLRAYSTTVKIVDAPNPDEIYTWGVVYTLGNIDANVYIYPGGNATASGMKVDLVLTSQTFDFFDDDADGNTYELGPNWSQGGHLMLVDTLAQMGIGFLNSSFLVAANDLYISLQPNGISFDSTQARIAFKGRFGGGDMPNRLEPVDGFDLNANLEFNLFNFTLVPQTLGSNYLGFDATVNLANTNIANFSENTSGTSSDDGSFISLTEPSKPTVDFRFADMSGTLHFRSGRIDLQGDVETPIGGAQLQIDNYVDFGPTATATGTALVIGRVELGNRNLGSMVIPDGQWYTKFALGPQH